MSARAWIRAAVQSWLPARPGPRVVVRYEPRPSDRRATAEQLQPGDTVFVWAHDTPHLASPCPHDMWRYGTVVNVDHATAKDALLRPLQITLHDGQVVHTVPHAVAYVVAADVVSRPRPGDDPQPAPVEEPAPRDRPIKVAAIRPGMDVTVEPTSEARQNATGQWAAVRVHDRSERGQVMSTSRTGDLVMLHLWDGTDEDRGHGRRVYANARHGALLHVDADAPYDQEQEVTTP